MRITAENERLAQVSGGGKGGLCDLVFVVLLCSWKCQQTVGRYATVPAPKGTDTECLFFHLHKTVALLYPIECW